MKYIANPVIVDAYKIIAMGDIQENGDIGITLDNDETVIASKEMTARYMPKDDDYWVVQSDGYIYLNPKEVFERKYKQYSGE